MSKNSQSNHIDWNEYIDNYLEGLLGEAEQQEFKMKCLTDDDFYERFQEKKNFRKKVFQVIKEDGAELFPENKKSYYSFAKMFRFLLGSRPIWKYAAIPAGAIAVVVFFVLGSFTSYKENSEYEDLLGHMRYMGSIAPPKILSPEMGEHIKRNNVHFKWEIEDLGPFEIIILNNKGEEIEEIKTRQKFVINSKKLTEGVYYWKLNVNEEWKYMGKFFIDP